uniref:Uncharacterized protein n=1 Tax=Zea mays TaxID=4577 RepID=A0A804UC18_MAIZE
MALQPSLELLVGGAELLDLLFQKGRVRLLLLPVLAHSFPVPQRSARLRRVLPGVVVVLPAAAQDQGVRVQARVGVHGDRGAGRVAAVRVGAGRRGAVEELVEAVRHLRVGEEQLAGEVSSIVHCGRECVPRTNFSACGQRTSRTRKMPEKRERGEGIKSLSKRCSLKGLEALIRTEFLSNGCWGAN